MITRYVATARIACVEERFIKQRRSGDTGVGDKADMVDVSTGWWLVTEAPEPYAFRAGSDRPPHAVGQVVRLIVEVVET